MKNTICSLILAICCISCSDAQKTLSNEALNATMMAADGTNPTLADVIAKHKGKATVIEVWASWCGDCVKAMPKLKELMINHPEADYVFISMDKTEDKWRAGIAKHDLQGDHYWVADGMKGNFGKAADIDWIPRYIILDKEGNVVTYRAIETDFEKINNTLNTLKQ